MNRALKNDLINKYRASLALRYDYDRIKDDPYLPKHFTRRTVDELKSFFLQNLYSEPVEREKLDAAFKQLESFIVHPSKIWGLLGNLPAAIFRFGFHFPAAIKAGVSALETHSAARHFEDSLLQAAIDRKFKVPLSDQQFHECLLAIPVKQLEKLIQDLASLFHVISDKALLGKTILIMKDVLKRMETRQNIYGPEDTEAIELGIEIFTKGYNLLEKYDHEMKNEIVTFVIHSEKEFLAGLHRKN